MAFDQFYSFVKKYNVYVILSLLFFFSFYSLLSAFSPGPTYNGDNSAHYAFTVRLAEMLKEGNFRLWNPDANFGFPMLYYYQPLPYLITSMLYIVFPFVNSLFIYKFLNVFLLSCFPIAVYFGVTWMNFDKKTALFAAMLSLCIRSWESFGFEISSYFGWGLYTMLFGMLLYPLAVGYTVREYFGNRTIFWPTLLLSLTMLMHSFVGIAANISVALLILFSPKTWSVRNKAEDAVYLFKIVFFECLLVSFWIIPLITSISYYGGHPFDITSVLDGLGATTMFGMLKIGILFDYERIPIFTILVLGGIIICLFSKIIAQLLEKENKENRKIMLYALLNFFAFFILLIGPSNIPILKWFPGNGIVHFSRFFSGLDFFAIILAALAITFFYEVLPILFSAYLSLEKKQAQALLFVLLFLLFSYFYVDMYKDYSKTAARFPYQGEKEKFFDALEFLAPLPNGRVHPEFIITVTTNYLIYTIPMYAEKPASVSHAVGSQDSLGYFYVEQLNISNPSILNLANIKYFIALKESNNLSIGNISYTRESNYSSWGTMLYANEEYEVYGINTSGYFDVMQTNTVVLGDNKEARELILQWMKSDLPKEKNFITIGDDREKEFFEEQGYENIVELNNWNETIREMEAQNKTLPCGTVLSEYVEDGLYRTEVEINKVLSTEDTSTKSKNTCYVLLKVGAHKDWRAYVDGKEVSWVQVSPSFMAVPVSEGEHTIEFSFAPRPLRFILLVLSLLALVALFLWEYHNFITKKE